MQHKLKDVYLMKVLCSKDLGLSSYKGKKPYRVWWSNIGCEKYWNEDAQLLPRFVNENEQNIIKGMEQLCLLIASQDDLVILSEKPPQIMLDNLKLAGKKIPEIIVTSVASHESITQNILHDEKIISHLTQVGKEKEVVLLPFGITGYEEELAKSIDGKLLGASSKITSWVNNKVNDRYLSELAAFPTTEGRVCCNLDEVERAYRALASDQTTGRIVVKEPYGASGKGLYIIEDEKNLNFLLRYLKRKKIESFQLIVERWYKTLLDVNYQVFIRDDGKVYYVPPKAQIVKRGIYTGCDGIGDSSWLTNEQREYFYFAAENIANLLYQKGYWGMASIDSIVTEEKGIIPIIEINGRFSLSTYISFISDFIRIKGNVVSRYYNIKPGVSIEQVFALLEDKLYYEGSDSGIIIYSVSEAKTDGNSGRLFLLAISADEQLRDLLYDVRKRLDGIIL